MSAPVTTPGYYTAPAKRESVRSRAGRSKIWLVALALIVLLAISVALTQRPTDYTPLSTKNLTETGTHAVAQILRAQGVSVTQFDTLARVPVTAPSTTTLVIANGDSLTDAQIASVLAYKGDVLFIGASEALATAVDPNLTISYDFLPETVDAACFDPDAAAAERMRVEYTGLVALGDSAAELCFLNRSDVAGMAVVPSENGTRTIVTNPLIYQNSALLTDGNAALALRTAGHHAHLSWYMGDYYDSTLLAGPGGASDLQINADFLPPGFGTALYALGLTALVAALWRGRRFGPLAVEPLPVVVRASEATRGRARLYRRARAYGRATAALRASAARRMGLRLGVPRTTERDAFVAAVQRASGHSAADIARILYGPPPTNEADMISIVDQLDELEGKVHPT